MAAIRAETSEPSSPLVAPFIPVIRRRFGDAVAAVLFYGSCLRTNRADGLLDLYVLVDGYRAAYANTLAAAANALVPPNVFHMTATHDGMPVHAKVAVMSLTQFAGATRRGAWQVSIWARFCQRVNLVYARDAAAAAAVRAALVNAIVTAGFWAARLAPVDAGRDILWECLFRATYAAELRAERDDRPAYIYKSDQARYDALTASSLAAAGVPITIDRGTGGVRIAIAPGDRRRACRAWARRRGLGKVLSIVRLAKAGLTFEGGIDYVCWKIERHTGVRPVMTEWEKCHPLLAAPWIVLRIYRRGTIR